MATAGEVIRAARERAARGGYTSAVRAFSEELESRGYKVSGGGRTGRPVTVEEPPENEMTAARKEEPSPVISPAPSGRALFERLQNPQLTYGIQPVDRRQSVAPPDRAKLLSQNLKSVFEENNKLSSRLNEQIVPFAEKAQSTSKAALIGVGVGGIVGVGAGALGAAVPATVPFLEVGGAGVVAYEGVSIYQEKQRTGKLPIERTLGLGAGIVSAGATSSFGSRLGSRLAGKVPVASDVNVGTAKGGPAKGVYASFKDQGIFLGVVEGRPAAFRFSQAPRAAITPDAFGGVPFALEDPVNARILERSLPQSGLYSKAKSFLIAEEIGPKTPMIPATSQNIGAVRGLVRSGLPTTRSAFSQPALTTEVSAFAKGPGGLSAVDLFTPRYGGIQFGSRATVSSSPTMEQVASLGLGKEFLPRKPGDVDLMFSRRSTTPFSKKVRGELLPKLVEAGNPFFIDPKQPLLVQVRKGSGVPQSHAVDIHTFDSAQIDALAGKGAQSFFGYPTTQGPKRVTGAGGRLVDMQVLSEQFLRKGASAFTLRFTRSGDPYFGPEAHRAKDISDFAQVSRVLEYSRVGSSRQSDNLLRISDLAKGKRGSQVSDVAISPRPSLGPRISLPIISPTRIIGPSGYTPRGSITSPLGPPSASPFPSSPSPFPSSPSFPGSPSFPTSPSPPSLPPSYPPSYPDSPSYPPYEPPSYPPSSPSRSYSPGVIPPFSPPFMGGGIAFPLLDIGGGGGRGPRIRRRYQYFPDFAALAFGQRARRQRTTGLFPGEERRFILIPAVSRRGRGGRSSPRSRSRSRRPSAPGFSFRGFGFGKTSGGKAARVLLRALR